MKSQYCQRNNIKCNDRISVHMHIHSLAVGQMQCEGRSPVFQNILQNTLHNDNPHHHTGNVTSQEVMWQSPDQPEILGGSGRSSLVGGGDGRWSPDTRRHPPPPGTGEQWLPVYWGPDSSRWSCHTSWMLLTLAAAYWSKRRYTTLMALILHTHNIL